MIQPKPARGTAKREHRKRRRGVKDAAYLAWLHTQPCIVRGCRSAPSAHHERAFSPSDHDAVPLCHRHHQGPEGRHGLRSLGRFEAHYGVSVRNEIARLRALYQGGNNGCGV